MRRKKLRLVLFISAAAALVISACALSVSLDKSIALALEGEVTNLGEEMMNRAIASALVKTPEMADILAIQRDAAGGISSVSVDNAAVNAFTVSLTKNISELSRSLSDARLSIPLGNIMFSRLFSGEGPSIAVKVSPINSFKVRYRSEFTSSGINQTLFVMYAEMSMSFKTRAGFFTYENEISRRAAVCSIIIVGNVPQTYANLTDMGDFLNLVP